MQGIREAAEDNSFWPAPAEVRHSWLWSYVRFGAMEQWQI